MKKDPRSKKYDCFCTVIVIVIVIIRCDDSYTAIWRMAMSVSLKDIGYPRHRLKTLVDFDLNPTGFPS